MRMLAHVRSARWPPHAGNAEPGLPNPSLQGTGALLLQRSVTVSVTLWNRMTAVAVGSVVALALASPAFAQETVEQRLDRLERQNQKLQEQNARLMGMMNTGGPVAAQAKESGPLSEKDVKSIISGYLKEKEDAKKQQEDAKKLEEEQNGYRIGSDLKMSANWKDGVWLTTRNNDFTMHIGGWVMYDNVWWDQSGALIPPPGASAGPVTTVKIGGKTVQVSPRVLSGDRLGGIGDLQDGTSFRRVRFMMDGTFWENYEYTLILALENFQINTATIGGITTGVDEFWVGAKNVPLLGTIRVGHVKAAHGLEGDMTASSRTMTFMERSSYSEAIENNINFISGLWIGNTYFDQRATWTTSLGRSDIGAIDAADYGDGQYIAIGRLTALPLYCSEGRDLVHIGASGGWLKAQNNLGNPAVYGSALHVLNLQARPELRDDVPAGGVVNGNSIRMVSTGNLACNSEWNSGLEFLWIRGPFSVQAEYGWAWLNDVQGQAGAGRALATKVIGTQAYMFDGGYLQLAYTLTGENRAYDKRLGRLNTQYFGPQGPFTNAWFVRDENGRLDWGWGAWEIAARLSYLDLNAAVNNGKAINRIQGGKMDGMTVGLNWYLNNNLKLMFDYVYNYRYDLPVGGVGNTLQPTNPLISSIPGATHGVGVRMQFMW
jgi:phosphate-selective porin OprO/OprP